MSVKSNLKDVAVAVAVATIFSAAAGGVIYHIEDAQYYKGEYPSLSLKDAQTLREDSVEHAFYRLSCLFAVIFLAEREREKRQKDNPDNPPKIS